MSQLKNMQRGGKPEVIILEPGTFMLGRDPECTYRLDHPSISTVHCEIRRERGQVFVRDLGSTNGTFIEDCPVKDVTELLPDQVIRLGDTIWRFQGTNLHVGKADTRAHSQEEEVIAPTSSLGLNRTAKTAAEAETNLTPPALRPCSKNSRHAAIFICLNCRSEFCRECVRERQSDQAIRYYCPTCSGRCEDIGTYEIQLQQGAIQRERQRNLFLILPDIFRYPLRSSGIILMIGGSLMILFYKFMIAWASQVGPFGIGAIILFTFLFFGYSVAYLHKIVQHSANGDAEMPDWPDLSSLWDDIAWPTLQMIGIVLLSFGPFFGYLVAYGSDPNPWIWIPLLIISLIYFPMACLSVCMFNSLAAANPLNVFSSILKVLQNYYLASVIFWAAIITGVVIDIILNLLPREMLGVRIAAIILSTPVSLYLLVIEARVLGLIYHGNSDKLGWFQEKQ